jgi:hypothetical protein
VSVRGRLRAVAIAVGFGLTALPAATTTASAGPARASRTLSVKDEGRLKLVHSSGSTLIDEGPASGTIPGKTRVRFVYNGNPTVSAQITIFGRSGTIYAHGSGRLSNPTSASPSFSGTLTISSGSGQYAHAHGGGHMYGVFYRRSYALTVQTEGTLHY